MAKHINVLTEQYFKRGSSRAGCFTSEIKVALCMYRFIPASDKINQATTYEVR